ncbi:hypothetical protein KAZ82_00455 [Candidatus Babeliales bacterium]|nr:hypothetical protein [Candidatus Babeliales bacterium]
MIESVKQFQQKIKNFYQSNKRNFSWREDITPYRIFISEVMLQQTQTARVMYKFEQWMQKFQNFEALAQASSYDVLKNWQGLGYNRRGLFLHQSAKIIVEKYAGVLPNAAYELEQLPGIGINTAGSICAFAFNKPIVFIETNIRTVFLHEFFQNKSDVSDKEILKLVQRTLDYDNPREWYYALMDYGVFLKKDLKANNKSSKHYTRQAKFIGSRRQVRGAIVKNLTQYRQLTQDQLIELVDMQLHENNHDVAVVLQELCIEGIVHTNDKFFQL